jgi:energy-coupling factor transporter transmembrane protein EcfT
MQDLKIKQYEILVDYFLRQDQQYWIQYSVFLAANALLIYAFFMRIELMLSLILSVLGIILSIIWLLTVNRNTFYRDFRIHKAGKIEEDLFRHKYLNKYKILNEAPKFYFDSNYYNKPNKKKIIDDYREKGHDLQEDFNIIQKMYRNSKFQWLFFTKNIKSTYLGNLGIVILIVFWIVFFICRSLFYS